MVEANTATGTPAQGSDGTSQDVSADSALENLNTDAEGASESEGGQSTEPDGDEGAIGAVGADSEGSADDTEGGSEETGGESEDDEAKGEEGEEDKKEESEEDPEFEIDGEKVSLSDLKDAYALIGRATEAIEAVQAKDKELSTVVQALVENPMNTMLDIFANVTGDRKQAYGKLVELCESVVAQHMQWESMDPKDRLAKEKEWEAEELRGKLKEKEAAEASTAEQAEIAEAAKEISAEINTALKTGGFEKPTAGAVAKVAEILARAEELGIQCTTEKAVRAYKKELAKMKKEALADLNPEDLSPEKRKQLAKQNIETVKKSKKPGAKTVQKEQEQKADGPRVIAMSDFQDFISGKIK